VACILVIGKFGRVLTPRGTKPRGAAALARGAVVMYRAEGWTHG